MCCKKVSGRQGDEYECKAQQKFFHCRDPYPVPYEKERKCCRKPADETEMSGENSGESNFNEDY